MVLCAVFSVTALSAPKFSVNTYNYKVIQVPHYYENVVRYVRVSEW